MTKKTIHFHSEKIRFTLRKKNSLRNWIERSISKENRKKGAINFIFCDDKYLRKINLKYLNHDYFTDIITFDYSKGNNKLLMNRIPVDENCISGDIYISVDRVRENAKEYAAGFNDELHRVMIHGILHLCGYNDNTASEKETMRGKEDYYLSLHE